MFTSAAVDNNLIDLSSKHELNLLVGNTSKLCFVLKSFEWCNVCLHQKSLKIYVPSRLQIKLKWFHWTLNWIRRLRQSINTCGSRESEKLYPLRVKNKNLLAEPSFVFTRVIWFRCRDSKRWYKLTNSCRS